MGRRRSWLAVLAAVALATLLASWLPARSPLSSVFYPTYPRGVARLLTDAALDAGFVRQPVVQFRPVTFRAKIIYGKSPPHGLPQVKVAYSNVARLEASPREFTVTPLTDDVQDLNEGSVRPDGNSELTWAWQVVPKVSGFHELTLHVEPYVIVDNHHLAGFESRNKPIRVRVRIHRNERALDRVVTSIPDQLKIDTPDHLTVNRSSTVAAELPLHGIAPRVSAVLQLVTGRDSVSATVESHDAPLNSEVAQGSWTVTPNATGSADLLVRVDLQSTIGHRRLFRRVFVARSLRVEDSFWTRVQKPVLYLVPMVGLAAGLLGLWDRRRRRSGDQDPPEPATE